LDVVLHFSFEFTETGSYLKSGNELQYLKKDPLDFNPTIGEPIEFQNIEESAIVVAIIANNVEQHIFCEMNADSVTFLENLKNTLEMEGWKKRLDGTKVRKQVNR
jgi:hypothetical protein